MSPRAIAGEILVLVLAGLALFVELWTVVPAPNLPTLAVAVIAPEMTPWGIALGLLAASVAQVVARGWVRIVGTGCAALAVGFALIPWCLLPATLAACDREMHFVRLTDGARAGALLARRPYDLGTAIVGNRGGRAIRTQLDLPVRTRDGARLGLDLYTPTDRGPHPAIIIVYGGAWIFGSRAESAPLARGFAQRGYVAIVVDYRHAPAHRFPTQIDDVRDAFATVARNAGRWNVDVHRVAILGRSAGAQLALLAAYEPSSLHIGAVVGYYAPTDLVAGYRVPPRPDPADVRRILRAYLGGTPDEHPLTYVAASPVARVRSGLPPTLLIGGGRDELVRLAFAHELRAALRAHGDQVAALDLPWSNHAFDAIPFGTGGQIAAYYTERFIAGTVGN